MLTEGTGLSVKVYGPDLVASSLDYTQLRYLKGSDSDIAERVTDLLNATRFDGGCGTNIIPVDLSKRYGNDPRIKPGTLELWFAAEDGDSCIIPPAA